MPALRPRLVGTPDAYHPGPMEDLRFARMTRRTRQLTARRVGRSPIPARASSELTPAFSIRASWTASTRRGVGNERIRNH